MLPSDFSYSHRSVSNSVQLLRSATLVAYAFHNTLRITQ
jgi:hypothetical protein